MDEYVLDRPRNGPLLAGPGSNLDALNAILRVCEPGQAYPIEYRYYMTTKESVSVAIRELRALGFTVTKKPTRTEGFVCLLLAAHDVVPSLELINEIDSMCDMDEKLGGASGGWELSLPGHLAAKARKVAVDVL